MYGHKNVQARFNLWSCGAMLVGDITTAEQSVSQRYAQLETQITRHLQPLSIPDNNKQCNVLPV